jgi:hypothetical protein
VSPATLDSQGSTPVHYTYKLHCTEMFQQCKMLLRVCYTKLPLKSDVRGDRSGRRKWVGRWGGFRIRTSGTGLGRFFHDLPNVFSGTVPKS